MESILETIAAFFEQERWTLQTSEASNVLQTQFKGDNGLWFCYVYVKNNTEQLAFYSVCPVVVPADKRARMTEFIARANYGLIIGNFEMDFDDGELRYKTSIDVENDRLSIALVRNVVYANVYLMDAYLSGIMKIIYSDDNPVDVLNEMEKHFTATPN